jgi:aryl sulfotransferase
MALDIPIKNAEQQWAVWDSTRLNDFPFRDDDIIIGTWSKSGTTWMQQLVAQLVFQGDPEVYGQALSPWIEFRLLPKEEIFGIAEAQEHRRFIKTHSPLNCVPFLPQLKYIYAARDPKDVAWSMYHHHCITTPEAVDDYNNAPGRVGPPWVQPDCDVREYYLYFLENGYFPGLSPDAGYWPNIQSWWDGRQQPNVMLLHYNNMKSNFEDVARNVAAFLEIEVPETIWPQIIEHCGIEYMREQAKKFEVLDHVFEGGGANFINKGINGRWKDVLSQEEIDRCDDVALENLGEECARWLKTGVET